MEAGPQSGSEWRIVDVGGSRFQRRKHAYTPTWAPFFDDVDAIIFLAPISCFDQVLAEDPKVNRLEDSVLLWKAVCSNKLLAHVDLVLFLNKCDLLARKLAGGVRLSRYVRSYADRENDVETASKYFRGKFSAIQRTYSPAPRKFYGFCTSVTDTVTTSGILVSGVHYSIRARRLGALCFGVFLPTPDSRLLNPEARTPRPTSARFHPPHRLRHCHRHLYSASISISISVSVAISVSVSISMCIVSPVSINYHQCAICHVPCAMCRTRTRIKFHIYIYICIYICSYVFVQLRLRIYLNHYDYDYYHESESEAKRTNEHMNRCIINLTHPTLGCTDARAQYSASRPLSHYHTHYHYHPYYYCHDLCGMHAAPPHGCAIGPLGDGRSARPGQGRERRTQDARRTSVSSYGGGAEAEDRVVRIAGYEARGAGVTLHTRRFCPPVVCVPPTADNVCADQRRRALALALALSLSLVRVCVVAFISAPFLCPSTPGARLSTSDFRLPTSTSESQLTTHDSRPPSVLGV
ncbi:hypothetical protein EVG20_g9707 [Dentipellis fragilis]|uniref:G-alpha-domain-containing protein n=1 Tax=Dentipellis fragilis TaxID=205917 RepID=A0A4Y9XWC6_9AGAM|nr:hypothetical protein EVG20_g9707 [Dentipellis fragilis]